MTLRDCLADVGYDLAEEAHYDRIRLWRAWYRGRVQDFHEYSIFQPGKTLPRTRATLNMAKQGAEYWANLLWGPECSVRAADATANEALSAVLVGNDFDRQCSVLIERAWALGSGAFVVYEACGRPRIDYITAEHIYPLGSRNDTIESCAFAGTYTQGGRRMLYLMIHERQAAGGYVISNRYFSVGADGESLTEMPAPKGVRAQYGATHQRFAIIGPSLANNLSDSPLGLSIYANAVDTLKAIDLAYDGIKVSMEVGRPRIGVSGPMLQADVRSGQVEYLFDANDIAFYYLGETGAGETPMVKDLTTPYRAAQFEKSLQTQLTVYSQLLGLGEKSFQWQRGAVKTATEVISNDSAMLRGMERHQLGLRSALTLLAHGILDLLGLDAGQRIAVQFDDSVTRDKRAEALDAWQWVLAGKFPFWRYLTDYKGYDEADARRIAIDAVQSDAPQKA